MALTKCLFKDIEHGMGWDGMGWDGMGWDGRALHHNVLKVRYAE